ncbi:potassium transporter TrkG [Shigella flexneri]
MVEGELKSREGFLIVVLFWTVLGSVGALPFIFSEQPNLTVTDAFFESFSGLTTTGATTLVGLDSLPTCDSLLPANAPVVRRDGDRHWLGGGYSAEFWASGDAALRAEMPAVER